MGLIEKVKRIFHKPITVDPISQTAYGGFFPPSYDEVYEIVEWFSKRNADETDDCERAIPPDTELRIFLEGVDWYEFQNQSFYQELIQYLDNLRIQKAAAYLHEEEDLQETWE